MLVKYEASVRNHIKIEQQLKLHIECVQDKLDENEKTFANQAKEDNEKEKVVRAAQGKLKDLIKAAEAKAKSFENQVAAKTQAEDKLYKRIA